MRKSRPVCVGPVRMWLAQCAVVCVIAHIGTAHFSRLLNEFAGFRAAAGGNVLASDGAFLMKTPLSSVLIVDDEPAVRDLMARWVSALGLRPQTAASADEALATLRTQQYDLAVIDVMMPGRDGLWLATELRRAHPQMAVVIATAYTDLLAADPTGPAVADCLIKPFQRERFALAVDRGRQWRKETLEEVHWHALLSIELRDRAAQVSALLARRAEDDESAVLSSIIAERMPEMGAHGERVARFAVSVARELGLDGDQLQALELAARFHDVGKIAIPDALMAKPSPLTAGEMAIMRRHVDVGADILSGSAALADAAELVRASHEWFGGAGYPQRLEGEAIPLGSRIIAVADAYDAMTQDRAYRRRFDSADAIAELLRCSPGQFDPRVVIAFLAVLGTN
jgi:cyclic di-GMP phosphodiesterase